MLLMVFVTFLNADEFDIEENDSQKNVFFPMTEKEISQFMTVVPRILTKEELAEKRLRVAEAKAKREKERKIREAKIKKNFTNKSKLKEVKKKEVKVKVEKKEVDFFESLDDEASKPIDME